MNQEKDIAALCAENAKLRAELEELRDCSYKHFDLFTAHIGELEQDATDIFSYLMPLLYKVYPDFAETRRQIDQVLARRRNLGRGLDKKSS